MIDAIKLAEQCGAVANIKNHFNMDGDSIVFAPEELSEFANLVLESAAVECDVISEKVTSRHMESTAIACSSAIRAMKVKESNG